MKQVKEAKKRYFPCQYCKSQGRFLEEYIEGYPRYVDCGNCEGRGLIEIGGEIHLRNKAFKYGLKHLTKNKNYSWEEILEIGRKYL